MRGHGKTSLNKDEDGILGDDGFNCIVQDEYTIAQMIRKEYPGLPLFIFSHSFGTFVGQAFINRFGTDINGIIMCGSAAQTGLDLKLGKIVASLEMKLSGPDKKSKLLTMMAFGSYNKRIKHPKTTCDWISTDENEVKKYIDDPKCGFICSTSFYYQLSEALVNMYLPQKLGAIPKGLPIFLISGKDDPVGQHGKKVNTLYEIYKNAGIKNLSIKLYPGKRHELINETNKQEVYKDILSWLMAYYPGL